MSQEAKTTVSTTNQFRAGLLHAGYLLKELARIYNAAARARDNLILRETFVEILQFIIDSVE